MNKTNSFPMLYVEVRSACRVDVWCGLQVFGLLRDDNGEWRVAARRWL